LWYRIELAQMHLHLNLSLLLVILNSYLTAQLPTCHLYAFDIAIFSDSISVNNPRFLSAFNSNGYNNQAHFFSHDSFLFTSNYNNKENTDIFLACLKTKTITNLTNSPESEFSGKISKNTNSFTAVRVTDQAKPTQEIYEFGFDWSGRISRICEIPNVGYYQFKSQDTLIVFMVSDPHELGVFYIKEHKQPMVIAHNPGRCFQIDTSDNLLYVHKLNDDYWFLKSYNWYYVNQVIVAMPNKVEDFVQLNDGRIICADRNFLLYLDTTPTGKPEWKVFADLSSLGLNNLQRPAICPENKRLIVVNSPN
jgi:hypothetical protein